MDLDNKDNVVFKFEHNRYSHDFGSAIKQWNEIFSRYFLEVHGIEGVALHMDIIGDRYSDGELDEDGEPMDEEKSALEEIMPYTTNRIHSIKTQAGSTLASFYMYGQNNCCGAMSISATSVVPLYRNKKLGTLLQYYKEAIAAALNITRLYCTEIFYEGVDDTIDVSLVNIDTPYTANCKVLRNTNWKVIDLFKNKKSHNVVAMYSKSTNYESKEIIMNIKKEREAFVKIKNLTIGCDPELFLRDIETQEYVPSYTVITGDKKKPLFISDDGHNIQCDNVMVEYGVPPSRTSEEFVKNNMIVQSYLRDKVAAPAGLELVIFPYVEFSPEKLTDERASVFGCDPDFDVWRGGRPNIVGRPNVRGRSAGGHIHIGYDNHNQITNDAIVKALDAFLSIPLILMEPENKRKEMYGKAGAYRNQPWGVEYRVTSNYIFSSPELMKWAFNQVTEAINYINSTNGVVSVYPDLSGAINTKNAINAKKIMNSLNIKELSLATVEAE